MASPAKIDQELPDILPEDFGEWDSETSSATIDDPDGVEATRNSGEVTKPSARAPEQEASSSPMVDRMRGVPLPPREWVYADGGAFLRRQAPSAPREARSANSAAQREEVARSTHEDPFSPQRPKAAVTDGVSSAMAIPAESTPSPDEFLQFLRPRIAATMEDENPKKNWIVVAAVSACAIVVLVILAIRLFTPGTSHTVREAGVPVPTKTEAQAMSDVPKPSPSAPLTNEKPPAAPQLRPAADSQASGGAEEENPPEVQSSMNDQLAAPTRIPRDIKKPAVENEPPPATGFSTAGTENLGGGSPVTSAFNGGARPVVHAAVPVTISAGVAVGLLIRKTAPVYPEIAKTARVSGTVEIQAVISKAGTINDMHVTSGPVMLRQAALDAVRNWRYKPYTLNNEPTEVQTTIHVIFSLGG